MRGDLVVRHLVGRLPVCLGLCCEVRGSFLELSAAAGIIDGMAGLVKNPLIGAEKKGARGFVKGVATGVLGIAFKPVTGVLEFTSKAVAGVAASVQQVGVKGPSDGAADLGRVRAPAVAVLGRQVGVNEELCARWTEVVQRVRGGRYRKEVAVDLLQNKPNKAVIFTNNRIVYLNLRKRLVRWTARYSRWGKRRSPRPRLRRAEETAARR